MKELIKERIENRSITQKELAEKADISETHLSLILKGDRQLNYEIAKNIYKELGYNSPVSLIMEYFDMNSLPFDSDTKDNPSYVLHSENSVVETVGKLILTHLQNNDLSQQEKSIFIFRVIQFGEFILNENAENSFEKSFKNQIEGVNK